MKIVLDTNVLLNSFLKYSKNYWIWKALETEDLTLCLTNDILLEYEEIIARFYNDPTLASLVLDALQLLPNVRYLRKDVFYRLIPEDEADEKFIDCAIMANVDYLVTNDRHFDKLKKAKSPIVKIVNEDEFKLVFEAYIENLGS
jgi:uncharacterized protein